MSQKYVPFALSLVLILLAGCTRFGTPEPTPFLIVPSPITSALPPPTIHVMTATPVANITLVPTVTPLTSPTVLPPAPTTPLPPTPTVPPATPGVTFYRVVDVASNDTLNVRNGPGVTYDIVGELPPTATNIRLTGLAQTAGTSLWVVIEANGLAGWVNSYYLAPMLSSASFCGNTQVAHLLTAAQTALANGDDAAFARLIHPDKGVRLRTAWWNPEVHITRQQAFWSNSTVYDWGLQIGSGEVWQGTFSEVAAPPLQRDFAPATQRGCNTILHGGTPGLIQLPADYLGGDFYSLYRPYTTFELDWGSWAVGLEPVDGEYYITYLVHYAWEP